MSSGADGGPAVGLDGSDLAVLDQLPVAEHAAAYAGLHARLHEALTSLDEL